MFAFASTAVLAVSLITNGLLAGLFFVFSCAICPGFRRMDDRSYVRAFRAINRTILNVWFLSVFCAAPLTAVASAIMIIGREEPTPLGWLVAGAACSVLTFVITAAGNVPLNRALEVAPADTEQQQCRARQDFEARWNTWNHARTLSSIVALTALASLPQAEEAARNELVCSSGAGRGRNIRTARRRCKLRYDAEVRYEQPGAQGRAAPLGNTPHLRRRGRAAKVSHCDPTIKYRRGRLLLL